MQLRNKILGYTLATALLAELVFAGCGTPEYTEKPPTYEPTSVTTTAITQEPTTTIYPTQEPTTPPTTIMPTTPPTTPTLTPITTPDPTPEPRIMYEPTMDYYLYNDDILLESDLLNNSELQPYFETALKAYETIQDFTGIVPKEQLRLELKNSSWGSYLSWFIVEREWAPTIYNTDYNISALTHEMTHWFLGGFPRVNDNILNQIWFEEGLCNYIQYLPTENRESYSLTDLSEYFTDLYTRLKQGEDLFNEDPGLKNAHKVGIMFFIGLETDYGFGYSEMREVARELTNLYNEKNNRLDKYDLKEVIEGVAGQSMDDLYRILGPGIEYNAYYRE